ncbi:hypothetical protein [Wolbachia pipientis]|nr:hypothetical protein [Wolbachia pipientis]MDM8335633.1 hypothetical protein [Wolbachia pipientis]
MLHLVAYGNLGKVAGTLSKIKEVDVNAVEVPSLCTTCIELPNLIVKR